MRHAGLSTPGGQTRATFGAGHADLDPDLAGGGSSGLEHCRSDSLVNLVPADISTCGGASVSANKPHNIPEGKKIRMTISFDNQRDVKRARIVWADESGFGAKFI